MKKFSNFIQDSLSRKQQKEVLGGRLDDMSASANCGGGKTVKCSGDSCNSTDKGPGQEGGCSCSSGEYMDTKSCKDA
jgi:hypothetical protein